MVILGIDPGIGRCGYGVVRAERSRLWAINYGCIETSAKQNTPDRLAEIHEQVKSLIKKNSPDVLAIEELFFGANGKTAFAVGQARGVVLLAAAEGELPVSIYTPLQVKMAVTGYGRADKNQIGQMVKVILKLEKIPKLDDTSDALAVAVAHAFSFKLSSRI